MTAWHACHVHGEFRHPCTRGSDIDTPSAAKAVKTVDKRAFTDKII